MAGTTVAVPLRTGVVVGYGLEDGKPLWSTELRAEQSLAADTERIYVAGGEAIHALTATAGTVAWVARVGAKPTAPPLAHAGWIVAAAGGDVIAIRAADGVVMWRQRVGAIEFRASLDGELLVVSVVDGKIVAMDVRDGTVRWTSDLRASPGEPVVIGGRVYVGTKDRYFYSLIASSGRIEDHSRVATELLGRVAVTDRYVYFALLNNTVNAVLRRGGALRWHKGIPYRPGGGPVVVGDVVIVPGYVESPLPAFSADAGVAAGSVPFGGLLVALPVFLKLPDGRDAVIGITGGLDNKWTISLRTPSPVPPITVLPLTALPGVAVTIPPLAGR